MLTCPIALKGDAGRPGQCYGMSLDPAGSIWTQVSRGRGGWSTDSRKVLIRAPQPWHETAIRREIRVSGMWLEHTGQLSEAGLWNNSHGQTRSRKGRTASILPDPGA